MRLRSLFARSDQSPVDDRRSRLFESRMARLLRENHPATPRFLEGCTAAAREMLLREALKPHPHLALPPPHHPAT